MEKFYRFNLEFDGGQLTDGQTPRGSNFASDFEHVFFFINQESEAMLLSRQMYPRDYIGYLESLKLNCRFQKPVGDLYEGEDWWGNKAGLTKEKLETLTSKITAIMLANKLGLGHLAIKVINSSDQISSHLQSSFHRNWALRFPHSLSGREIRFISQENGPTENDLTWANKRLQKVDLILVPWLDRYLDIGTFVELSKGNWTANQHISLVDKRGKFFGCVVGHKIDQLAFQMTGHQFTSLLDKLEEVSPQIVDYYLQLGAQSSFGFDSFIYKENESFKLFAPCEINYRKTMGLMAHALKKFLVPGGTGIWLIYPKDSLSLSWENFADCLHAFGDKLYLPEKGLGIMPTSPVGTRFVTFFIAGTDYLDLLKKKSWLENFLRYRNPTSK